MRAIFKNTLLALLFCCALASTAWAQCGGIMEPGFAFLTSSRGCAPFTVNIQTLYLSSVPGTQYFVDWGDGTPEETYTQVGPTGVNISHLYPNSPVDCGYDVVIDAANACNPRGSVVPITTQVVVWTNDVISVNPAVFRVCQGFAADVLFTDNSDWNCFPRLTRENNEPRWIQWIYGTGAAGIRIPGIRVNSVLPGAFPYLDPAPMRNPIYPVLAPGQVALPVNVPVTAPADIGKEFEITLKNWNQCNAYDNNILDGNPFDPVGGDLVNGDNPPQVITARVVIVDAPQPDFLTRLGGAGGPVQNVFCVGDNIYFDDETPPIGGASFQYSWEFFDNGTGMGAPLSTSNNQNPTFAYPTSGLKLIRLSVKDVNAAGNCVEIFEQTITISPSLIARIGVTDLLNNPITPDFCQLASPPFTNFDVRFSDISTGVITPTTQWRWEFYDETNTLIRQEPFGGGFSVVPLGPFDEVFTNSGIYRVRLIIRDNVTSCETTDEVEVRVYENPVPQFTATRVCEGNDTFFNESSTLNAINGEVIALREWDFNYDGSTFVKDPAFDNQTSFTRNLGLANTYQVALRVTTDQFGCSDMVVIPVIVDPVPNASITPDVLSGCSVLTVVFANNSVGGQPDAIDRFEWEVDEKLGSGFQLVATQDPLDPGFTPFYIHNFVNTTMANRQFDMRMRTVTVNGCDRVSAISTITVFPGTESGFISTNYSPFNDNCSPQSVNFAVDALTQSLGPTDYRWRVSDTGGIISETSTGIIPSFSYNFVNNTQSIKDYFITLITTLPSGCFGDSTRTIRISPNPTSNFDIDTLLFDCQLMRLQLEATQKGLANYHWTVRENGIVVSDVNSINDELNYELNRPASGSADITVQFNLETTNFANCISPVSSDVVVIPARDDINTSFTASPTSQSLPNATVTIVNTTNPGPWTYEWDFGDGSTSIDPGVSSHTYATYGTYNIKLTVTNGVCVETAMETVTILAIPPIVDFAYDPASGCAPLTVNFTNLSQFAEPDKYQWGFGQGQATSKAINPTYTYFEPGKYTVSLSASNATGAVVNETKEMIIEVFPRPSAQFDIKPKRVYIPGGTLYTKNQSLQATHYEWDFGDGTISLSPQPQHIYSEVGKYDIQLIAYNQFGCADTTKLESIVNVEIGGQVLIPNAFSPNLSGATGGNDPGNGKNDVFLPITRGVVEFEMMIFNRWGELMFRSTDPAIGWDGYYRGKLCQQDVYMYKLSALYENGERVVRVGDVNLIR
ncbi:MAG: PKD domain-containing protein [Cyclobacteriaceae bacterium]|nr:PKD domain-containing protein [Cyclobacteriaceae bacterium]MCW5901995.1 PKD domain-containing protein [Cyclobacteriaceae bacterium]